eukprot:COSAG01_NODE_74021_length_230_cov_3.366412_1_plen_58_part_10
MLTKLGPFMSNQACRVSLECLLWDLDIFFPAQAARATRLQQLNSSALYAAINPHPSVS